MKRQGKTLAVLQDGHPRRLADMRNAWRKASVEQRQLLLDWIVSEGTVPADWTITGRIDIGGAIETVEGVGA